LRNKLPSTFWTFLIGSASLSALPLVTAGFYSKDLILWQTWSSPSGRSMLWAAGLLGAFITSIYTFRMVFVTFFGDSKKEVSHTPGARMIVPLAILAFFSIVGGFVEIPDTLGDVPLFSNFLQTVFNEQPAVHSGAGTELLFQIIAAVVSLAGILVAYLFFLRRPLLAEQLSKSSAGSNVQRFWFSGWGFDLLYEKLFINPFLWIARINRNDVIDSGYTAIAHLNRIVHDVLSKTQTGSIRWYAMGMALGAVVFLGVIMIWK
jgi:NADH-quinone oxidoreductase subunit L